MCLVVDGAKVERGQKQKAICVAGVAAYVGRPCQEIEQRAGGQNTKTICACHDTLIEHGWWW